MAPKRPRGQRGGNPHRPSQVRRQQQGLPSELDPESSHTERVAADTRVPVEPPARNSGRGHWRLQWAWVEEDRPEGEAERRSGEIITESVRHIPPPRVRSAGPSADRPRRTSPSRTPRAPVEEPPSAASSSSRPRLTQPVPRHLAPTRRTERREAPAAIEEAVEKPVILVDFHKTVSFEGVGTPEGVVQDLQIFLDKGFALGILSFASREATQREVQSAVNSLRRRLRSPSGGDPLPLFLTRTKFSFDRLQPPSITGHSGSKAALASSLGACLFIDDQQAILDDVAETQAERSTLNRTVCLKASRSPHDALIQLREYINYRGCADFGVPSFLGNL